MFYLDNIQDVAEMLRKGQAILIPTECGWCVCTTLDNIDKLTHIIIPTKIKIEDQYTVLVSSLQMYKDTVPDLHPRIETLLSLHLKTLGLKFKNHQIRNGNNLIGNSSIIRLVQDDYTKDLVENLGYPIVSARFYLKNDPIFKLEDLPVEILNKVDFTSQHRPSNIDYKLPVVARYNKKAILNFIRE